MKISTAMVAKYGAAMASTPRTIRATPSNMRNAHRALNVSLTPRCKSFSSEFIEAMGFAFQFPPLSPALPEKSAATLSWVSLALITDLGAFIRPIAAGRIAPDQECRQFQCFPSDLRLGWWRSTQDNAS